MESKMTCDSCPYFQPLPQGECRRNPPQGVLLVNQQGKKMTESFWPPTRGDMWCGHHPQREIREEYKISGDTSVGIS